MSLQIPTPNFDPKGNDLTEIRFAELTGGISKGGLYKLASDMRTIGHAEFEALPGDEASVVTLDARNGETDGIRPVMTVASRDAETTVIALGGTQCSIFVKPFGIDAEISGRLPTERGVPVENPDDFGLIPKPHWDAMKHTLGRIRLGEQAQREQQAVLEAEKIARKAARKHGGGILRSLRLRH